jgi:hypothetical protein
VGYFGETGVFARNFGAISGLWRSCLCPTTIAHASEDRARILKHARPPGRWTRSPSHVAMVAAFRLTTATAFVEATHHTVSKLAFGPYLLPLMCAPWREHRLRRAPLCVRVGVTTAAGSEHEVDRLGRRPGWIDGPDRRQRRSAVVVSLAGGGVRARQRSRTRPMMCAPLRSHCLRPAPTGQPTGRGGDDDSAEARTPSGSR